METVRKTKVLTPQGAYLKDAISRNRGRAILVGVIYLLAILAFAAAGVYFLLKGYAPIGKDDLFKAFANAKSWKSVDALVKTTVVCAALYAIMLLVLVWNVLSSLFKINWLFKVRGSRMYGFNRNGYAMNDLGKTYSASFAMFALTYFLCYLLLGASPVPPLFVIIALGAGVVIHLFTAYVGAKISYYDYDNGKVIEQKRKVGRCAPFFRNLFQLCTIFGTMFLILKVNGTADLTATLLASGGFTTVKSNILLYIPVALQALSVLCLIVLVFHAISLTEYDLNGVYGPGRKTFRVFSLFLFIFAAGATACKYFLGEAVMVAEAVSAYKSFDMWTAILAGAALVMFVIEILMRNAPKIPGEKQEEKKGEPAVETKAEAVEEEDEELETTGGEPAPAPYEPTPNPYSPFRKEDTLTL